jgi:hypothetical protein
LDVIVTSDAKNIPPDILALQDETKPLPPEAVFFEEQFTFSGLAWNAFIGVVLAVIGLLSLLFCAVVVVDSFRSPMTVYSSGVDSKLELGALCVGLVFFLGSYLMITSLLPAARLAWSGRRSRYGITLLGDSLISYSLFNTAIIPRGKFSGIAGGKIEYLMGENKRSFNLPPIVGDRRSQLEAAVQSWASRP